MKKQKGIVWLLIICMVIVQPLFSKINVFAAPTHFAEEGGREASPSNAKKSRTEEENVDEINKMQIATFCGQQGRISRTVRAILSGQFEGTAGLGYPGPANQY